MGFTTQSLLSMTQAIAGRHKFYSDDVYCRERTSDKLAAEYQVLEGELESVRITKLNFRTVGQTIRSTPYQGKSLEGEFRIVRTKQETALNRLIQAAERLEEAVQSGMELPETPSIRVSKKEAHGQKRDGLTPDVSENHASRTPPEQGRVTMKTRVNKQPPVKPWLPRKKQH